MASIDDLFRKPTSIANPSAKRKLEDPTTSFSRSSSKSAKLANGTSPHSSSLRQHPPPPPSSTRTATVEDEERPPQDQDLEDVEAGPAPPPEDAPDELGDDEEGRFFGSGVNDNEKSALNLLDQDDGTEAEDKIDLSWLKKTALNFERKINKNAELRAKYENDPMKFVGSEADLDAEIKNLSLLAEHGDLYKDFVKSGCVASLVGLLAHENTDIAIAVCQVLSELTDEDAGVDDADWKVLVDALIKADVVDLLVSNLSRLDEAANENDRDGVYHVLSVIENLSSEPSNLDKIGSSFSLWRWLVTRVQTPDPNARGKVSQNRQYAAELLAILLQDSKLNRTWLTQQTHAVNATLMILADYRKHDPEKDSDEEEFVENLFDILTCLVDDEVPAEEFLQKEGVELCLIMLREGHLSKSRALKVLDHAMSGVMAATICNKFVEAAGLKTVFGMLMKSGSKKDKAKEKHGLEKQSVEHIIGMIASLLRYTLASSPERIRTLAKFVENDYEKISRLIELRKEYKSRMDRVEAEILLERQEEVEIDQEMEDMWLGRRLDAGVFSLQTLNVILAWLVAEDDKARIRIKDALDEAGGLDLLAKNLREQLDGINVDDDNDKGKETRDMLEALISCVQ